VPCFASHDHAFAESKDGKDNGDELDESACTPCRGNSRLRSFPHLIQQLVGLCVSVRMQVSVSAFELTHEFRKLTAKGILMQHRQRRMDLSKVRVDQLGSVLVIFRVLDVCDLLRISNGLASNVQSAAP
jgi:hypothetical protein